MKQTAIEWPCSSESSFALKENVLKSVIIFLPENSWKLNKFPSKSVDIRCLVSWSIVTIFCGTGNSRTDS